jgi:hypothetical protein
MTRWQRLLEVNEIVPKAVLQNMIFMVSHGHAIARKSGSSALPVCL